jgi:transcriptional regulator with XRE-family HTH domain
MSNEIGHKLRFYRKSLEFNQSFVAKKLGISQRAYSKIECGETRLDVDKLLHLSLILGFNVYDMLKSKRKFNESNQKIQLNSSVILIQVKEYEKKISALEQELTRLKRVNR